MTNHVEQSELGSLNESEASENEGATAWSAVRSELEREIHAHIFSAYISQLSFIDVAANGEVTLAAPSKLICSHVSSQFGERISTLFSVFLARTDIKLRIIVNSPTEDSADQRRVPATPFVVKRARIAPVEELRAENSPDFQGCSINSRYTFSDFVVGNSNQFCHAAAMRVAENPGQSYNPLFIYGGVGLGKTHLLHAIGNMALEQNPNARILYMSSETFTNELILALRNAKMEEFKRRLRGIEILLIDDIQFIAGKERTQEEFFHTFNALYSAKRQIVITSDKSPIEIPGIEERLQTRFSWGLTADLQAPDFETRVAILNQKAQLENFDLPETVAHMIADRISSNVRELEGALTRLHAVSSIQNIAISDEMAQNALKHLLQPKTVVLTIDDIKRAVAEKFSVKVSDIISKRRTKNLSFPRHIAMYLCRKYTTCSYPEIGEKFGGRDHSSVIHAASVVSGKITTDSHVREVIADIEKSLLG